jgi:hypothetical protein
VSILRVRFGILEEVGGSVSDMDVDYISLLKNPACHG